MRSKIARPDGDDANTSTLDLLLNMALFFAAVFMLALAANNQSRNKKDADGIQPRAQMIIMVTWPEDQNADVDTYVQDPANNVVMYRRREDGLMHLDRDDQGTLNDDIILPDGTKIKHNVNKEIVTIRELMNGEYIINLHVYNLHTSSVPIPVTVEIIKVEPYVNTIFKKVLELNHHGEEITVTRFIVKNKEVKEFNDLQKQFVYTSR